MRSMLAGVAETGSETAKRLEGFASVRSTLAGVAETGSGGPRTLINSLPCVRGGGPRSGGRVVKKISPQSACADSSLYTKEPENSPIIEVSFALSSKQKTEMRNHLCFLIIKIKLLEVS